MTGIVTGEPVCYVTFSEVMRGNVYDGQIVYVTGFLSKVKINNYPRNILFESELDAKAGRYDRAILLGPFSKDVDGSLMERKRRELSRTERMVNIAFRFRSGDMALRRDVIFGAYAPKLYTVQTPPPPPRNPPL